MPRIVILDGYTLNPGDLNWSALSAIGDLTVYDRTPPELILERAAAESALARQTPLTREIIAGLPEMACRGSGRRLQCGGHRRGPGARDSVTNVPGYGAGGGRAARICAAS